MKKRLTKEDYDKLTPEMKALYKADGDKFVLDLEDDDDAGAALRARDAEKRNAAEALAAKEAAEKKYNEAKAELDKLNGTANNMSTENIELKKTLEGLGATTTALQKKFEAADKYARDATIATVKGNTATQIAQKLFGPNAKLMQHHVEQRLDVEFPNADDPRTGNLVIKGADGKVSKDMTLDTLAAEFTKNPDFASVLVGSKAHGGSAPRRSGYQPGSGGALPGQSQTPGQAPPNLGKMAPAELLAAIAPVVASNRTN